jgi:probable phosphoglycerate mutase
MGLRLVLLRHGETDWGPARRYQGSQDIPLSPAGRAQAEAAARLLGAQPLAAVWSSPLRRARDTALAIARAQGLEVREHPGFKEMGFGEWEGLTADEVRARFPEALRAWVETPHLASWPGAEPLERVRRRVLAGLEDLRRGHDGCTVCLVAHGVTGRVLVLEALGLGLDRLWSVHLSYTGISELEFGDEWTALHRMNTLVHLERVSGAG